MHNDIVQHRYDKNLSTLVLCASDVICYYAIVLESSEPSVRFFLGNFGVVYTVQVQSPSKLSLRATQNYVVKNIKTK